MVTVMSILNRRHLHGPCLSLSLFAASVRVKTRFGDGDSVRSVFISDALKPQACRLGLDKNASASRKIHRLASVSEKA